MATATETAYRYTDTRELARRDASVVVLCTAELAECTCPDSCERDHDRD